MSKEDNEITTLHVTLKPEKSKEICKYLKNTGASFSELVNALVDEYINSPKISQRLCYEYGRVTPEQKGKIREKILKKFKNLGRFAHVLGVDRSYIYLIFNGHRKGSPELWKRVFLAIKD